MVGNDPGAADLDGARTLKIGVKGGEKGAEGGRKGRSVREIEVAQKEKL